MTSILLIRALYFTESQKSPDVLLEAHLHKYGSGSEFVSCGKLKCLFRD